MEQLDQLVPADAEGFSRTVEVKAMACLILNLGEQDRLALECRRTGYPIAFRQLADNFRMSMLTDLTDQGLAIAFRHPVRGFDFLTTVNAFLKGSFLVRHLRERENFGRVGFYHLGIHDASFRHVEFPKGYLTTHHRKSMKLNIFVMFCHLFQMIAEKHYNSIS